MGQSKYSEFFAGLSRRTGHLISPRTYFPGRSLQGRGITNCKGVPGTLGCFAYARSEKKPVMLSSWHVLYARSSGRNDKVWLMGRSGATAKLHEAGRVIDGRIGNVTFGNAQVYLDCAISSWTLPENDLAEWPASDARSCILPRIEGVADAKPGEIVFKYGAVTGLTRGFVSDISYEMQTHVEGRPLYAKTQLLIESGNEHPFSARGDSGAVIMNEEGKVVGLLWGTTPHGEGVACPIMPVMDVLDIGELSSHVV